MILAQATPRVDSWAIGLTLALGFVAVYALLPRPRRPLSPWLGCLAGGATTLTV